MKAPTYIIIAFLLILTKFCLSQVNFKGIPYYVFFPIESYGLPEQLWHLAEDNRGFIYVGANNGLWEYDGTSWEVYKTDKNNVIRFVLPDKNGRIYIGGMKTLGYFEPNKSGKLVYYSLIPLISNEELTFNDVWQIRTCGEYVYFQSIKKIFRYRPDSNFIDVIKTNTDLQLSGIIENQIYIGVEKVGLCKISGNKTEIIPGGAFFKDKIILNILPYDSENMLLSDHHKIYIFNYKKGSFNSELSEIINLNLAFSGQSIYQIFYNRNKHFVISTINSGVYIVNRKGKILKHYSSENVFPSDVVFFGLESSNGNLWFALDNGIIKFENALPIRKISIEGNKSLKVISIIKHHGYRYYATNIGLYYMRVDDSEPNNDLYRFNNINTACNDFDYFINCKDTSLLLASEQGVFLIKDTTARLLTNKLVISTVHQLKTNPDIIFVGTNKGFGYFKYSPIHFSEINFIDDISGSVGKIIEDQDNGLWVGTYNNGFYTLKINHEKFKVNNFFEYKGVNKNNSEFAVLKGDDIYFLTANGVFVYSFINGKTTYAKNQLGDFLQNQGMIYLLEPFNDSLYWISYYHNESSIPAQIKNNTYPEYNKLFNRLKSEGIFSIYQESLNKIWFGTKNGIINIENFDTISIYKKSPKLFFRKVSLNSDSVIYNGAGNVGNNQFKIKENHAIINQGLNLKNNSLSIVVSSPSFFSDDNMLYSYLLKEANNEWSQWSKQNVFEFNNLTEGNYSLLIKAMNIFDVESDPIILDFRILPPWNRTLLAYIIKICLIVILVIGIFRFFIKRYDREKVKLERIIAERSSKILDQKAEIESQAKLLDQKNKSLSQLSIVARKTNNPVIFANSKGEVEWVNISFYKYFKIPNTNDNKVKLSQLVINSDLDEKIKLCMKQKKPVSCCIKFNYNQVKDIYFQTTVTPILDQNNNVVNLILVCSDITNIFELNKTRDIIISVITHDLKSPLLGFRMMLKTLLDHLKKYSTNQIRDKIQVMYKSSTTIYDLLEDLTKWFKSQRDMLTFMPNYINLSSLIEDLIVIYTEQASGKLITIENRVHSGIVIYADERMVRTIFRNLISNSLNSTNNGFIWITAENKGKMIEISVSDQGRGFDDDAKSKIFNYQYNEGLGLMISKEFVLKNGGTIWVADCNEGAKISFTLPFEKTSITL